MRHLWVPTFVICGALLAGCQGSTRSGTDYTQTITRELHASFAYPIDIVQSAARNVLAEELGFTIVEDSADALEGVIRAETARGREVKIETVSEGANLTEVQVWVGPLGDEPMSREILNRIDARL